MIDEDDGVDAFLSVESLLIELLEVLMKTLNQMGLVFGYNWKHLVMKILGQEFV